MKKDNQTLRRKVSLRLSVLQELGEPPRVLETHGGWGLIYLRCYRGVEGGVVFEKDGDKSEVLARQRPSWAVYEGDCAKAIAAGAGLHHRPNLIDLDPYGEPWPVVDALLSHADRLPEKLALVVNDGLRQKCFLNNGWCVDSLRSAVKEFGNERLGKDYVAVAKWLLETKAGEAGYRLSRWTGYYCGKGQRMTHYAAVLEKCGEGDSR